jgi:hypothetical protein
MIDSILALCGRLHRARRVSSSSGRYKRRCLTKRPRPTQDLVMNCATTSRDAKPLILNDARGEVGRADRVRNNQHHLGAVERAWNALTRHCCWQLVSVASSGFLSPKNQIFLSCNAACTLGVIHLGCAPIRTGRARASAVTRSVFESLISRAKLLSAFILVASRKLRGAESIE